MAHPSPDVIIAMANTSLEVLLQKSKKVFSNYPGVVKIFPYGSLETKQVDKYSDLDLCVQTTNPKNKIISKANKLVIFLKNHTK